MSSAWRSRGAWWRKRAKSPWGRTTQVVKCSKSRPSRDSTARVTPSASPASSSSGHELAATVRRRSRPPTARGHEALEAGLPGGGAAPAVGPHDAGHDEVLVAHRELQQDPGLQLTLADDR